MTTLVAPQTSTNIAGADPVRLELVGPKGEASTWAPASTMGVKRGSPEDVAAGKAALETIWAKTADERAAGAKKYAELASAYGALAFSQDTDLLATMAKAFNATGKKDHPIRSGVIGVFSELVAVCGKEAELVLFPVFQNVLDFVGDKASKKVREEAEAATKAFMPLVDKNSTTKLMSILINKSTSLTGANLNRLELLDQWIQSSASRQVQFCLDTALPAIAQEVHDPSKDISAKAKSVLQWLLATCSNPDVVPLVPEIQKGLMTLDKIEDTVDSLAGTTFIQNVDVPTLCVMAPILLSGLAQKRSPATKRACARIIENMSKLVEEPRDLATFNDAFCPLLEKARDSVADQEVREVCGKALEMFLKKSDVTKSQTNEVNGKVTLGLLKVAAAKCCKALPAKDQEIVDSVLVHISEMLVMLNQTENFDEAEWQTAVTPYLALLLDQADAASLTSVLLTTAESMRVKAPEKEEVVDAEELCRCDFSLAYGNKVLLKKTQLVLHRGFKYGLMGGNDCGKTSLMKAIAANQIDGLPPPEELRTVFVETDIQGELSDLTVLDYIYADELLRDCGVSREDMAKKLNEVGFCAGSPANIDTPVGNLSGGWKMKLALSRAMLLKADILLLDEPTNHLDVHFVKWLQDYLISLENTTVVVVSHDVKLLDQVCNNIIHIQDLKLENFRGNLSDFVKVHPEARTYFELVSTKFSFKFPTPGKIPGINSKGKTIMSMKNITFTYPGVAKPQLTDVSVIVALASRVGIVGVNGAGKSTMIRLLTGELEPDKGSGEVYKHPNARVGYIAQHAFHHIEAHLDKTCNEYIRWRYQTGDDREALVKVTAIMTEEELKAQRATVEIMIWDYETGMDRKTKCKIEQVFHTRQMNNKSKRKEHEYECTLASAPNKKIWIGRKALEENGWAKTLKQIDERIALRETQFARPLTVANVTNHMADVGLEAEFSTHVKIGALSTGQKVKVVLGAALWNQPHILILDEPTNYLDRESLGALAGAIREFEGGVIMISHNSQFVDTLCPVIWHLENGTLNVKGDADWMREAKKIKIDDKEEDVGETEDRFGNKVVAKKAKKKELTRKEKREKEKRRARAIKNGLEPSSDDDW
jgi:elongation factor 3